MAKCAKQGCENESAENQKYCCREHAPYGHMLGEDPDTRTPIQKKRDLQSPPKKQPLNNTDRIKKLENEVSQLRSRLLRLEVSSPVRGRSVSG